jgi:Ca2+-binding RTX toxin-like protein
MWRTTLLLTAAVVAAGLAAPLAAAPAQAAPSCHGQRATIVGKPRSVITGTGHRDVIVTNGAKKVRSLGGDDLICVDAHSVVITLIYSGAGDDSVYVSDRSANVRYWGASGSDAYQSVGLGDTVSLLGDGRDRISTGPGGDNVGIRTAGGNLGTSNVNLGPGSDGLVFIGDSARGHFEGGGGPHPDTLWILHSSHHVWKLDNVRGEAEVGTQVRFRWHGFEHFDLSRLLAPEIDFRGSDVNEQLNLEQKQKTRLVARMGAGDDQVFGGALDDLIDGGPGDDSAFTYRGDDTCISVEHLYDGCEHVG